MNKAGKRKVFKAVGCLLALGIAAIMLARCGDVNIDWQEEVRMADGEMLLVYRTAKGEKQRELGGPGGWKETEMSLEVLKLPDNWKLPPIWRKEYVPILLDYQPQEHIWSIVATFYYCTGWERLGRPDLPYIEYQSKNGGLWQVIPLEERLIGRKTNLLSGPSSKGEPKLVTAEERDRRNRRAAKEFRWIVSKWSNSCSPNSERKFKISWKEEVRMVDGETLLIYRATQGQRRATQGQKQAAAEVSLEVLKLPDGWVPPPIWRKEEDYQPREPTWKYVPILLDYQPQEHTWSMVITFVDCLGWERLGRPALPYVQYQSKNGEPWQVVPLEERLVSRKTNVFSGKRSAGQSKLTVEEKEKFYSSAADRFREILATWNNNCPPNLEGK